MTRRFNCLLTTLTFVFVFSVTGCSDSGPTSVTDGADQAAIDAYKEKERQIELESMENMDLGE